MVRLRIPETAAEAERFLWHSINHLWIAVDDKSLEYEQAEDAAEVMREFIAELQVEQENEAKVYGHEE